MASKGPKTGAGKPVRAPSAAPKPKRAPAKAAPKVAALEAEQKPEPTPEPVAEVVVTEVPAEAVEPAPVPEAAAQEEKQEDTIEAAIVAEPVIAEAEPAEAEESIVAEAAEAVEAVETETVEAVEAAAEPKKEAIMVDVIETTIAKTQTFFADINERTKTAVEKNAKLVEEFNDFAKGNVEAIVESGKITAKGVEALGQEAADYSRKSFETATAALKSLSAVKSPTDFFKLQGDFVRQSFDSLVAEASKNTEAMLKLAGDAAQPISNRWAVAADKIKTAA